MFFPPTPSQEREPVENVDDSSSKKCKTQDSQLGGYR